jgi:hypothetical protein
MNIQFFVCFHKKILREVYYTNPTDNDKYLTFYGVKEKESEAESFAKIIYEYELDNFNPIFQIKTYNEGSCLYHVYTNNLYTPYDYIGFCQYDMILKKDFFDKIKTTISNTENIIYYLEFFQWAFLGGQSVIIKDNGNIQSGLRSYNAFFNKNYTAFNLITNKMIICNTFLIPQKMYTKMMSWLVQYFKEDICSKYTCDAGFGFNPGHMIEALTSMFLSLEISEGAKYEKLDLEHNSCLKN